MGSTCGTCRCLSFSTSRGFQAKKLARKWTFNPERSAYLSFELRRSSAKTSDFGMRWRAVMTIDTELAAIGETGVTPEEEALAAFLLSAIERIKRGEEVDTGALQNESRELMEERRLRQISKFLMECAASVWDSLLGESPPEKSGLQDEIAPAGECVDETPPDPFPGEFAVIRLLGDGRWGRVWLAEDLNLGRKVAKDTSTGRGYGEGQQEVGSAPQ